LRKRMPFVGVTASAFPRHSASLRCLGVGQGGKPFLLRLAMGTDASPPADYGPVSEQCGMNIDLVKTGEVAGVVRSFHVNGQHDSKRRCISFLKSKVFSSLPTDFYSSRSSASVPG